ncbi:MAG: hypothetical protein JSU79_07010 [Dehalococcoidales bacterium]|nr:MAG: hypothetical protein JSU79_07010 [Dehalococcoidales bacterium]
MRWDTANPLSGPNGGNWDGYDYPMYEYGLGIDPAGNVWNTSYSNHNQINKYAPDGTLLGTYAQGAPNAQGCAADANGHVWVAHSFGGSSVGHLRNDGFYVGTVPLPAGSGPTGVAVDANGKIWATGYYSQTVYRIDPTLGGPGADGITPIGAVDHSINLGGNLYNYSDMTGSTLQGAPGSGTWTVVYDSTCPGAEWGTVAWNADEPDDSSITVTAASSEDGVTFGPPEAASDGVDLTVANGRYLKVTVTFQRSSGGDSPILYDLTIGYLGDCNGPGPGSGPEVGGTILPINKLVLLTPMIALGILLAAWGTLILRRRRAQS